MHPADRRGGLHGPQSGFLSAPSWRHILSSASRFPPVSPWFNLCWFWAAGRVARAKSLATRRVEFLGPSTQYRMDGTALRSCWVRLSGRSELSAHGHCCPSAATASDRVLFLAGRLGGSLVPIPACDPRSMGLRYLVSQRVSWGRAA